MGGASPGITASIPAERSLVRPPRLELVGVLRCVLTPTYRNSCLFCFLISPSIERADDDVMTDEQRARITALVASPFAAVSLACGASLSVADDGGRLVPAGERLGRDLCPV
jgi:hypothetical protein